MQFFTADLHLGHSNIIKYCNRPFSIVWDMDKTIIDNWNKKVKPEDDVYIVGDFCFARGNRGIEKLRYYGSKLNGIKHLIKGNHDNFGCCLQSNIFQSIDRLLKVKIENQKIILCHYAMRVWDCSHHGSWHLYGHSHGKLPDIGGLCFDIGVDCHNFFPLSFPEIKTIMETRKPIDPQFMDHHTDRTVN